VAPAEIVHIALLFNPRPWLILYKRARGGVDPQPKYIRR
jgi:hypothetical protein